MNNKVTLPPISDIFTYKDPQRLGSMPRPHHYQHPPPAYSGNYPVVPMYSYQYAAAATAAANPDLPPLYPGIAGSSPSYSVYGLGYTSGLSLVTGSRYGITGGSFSPSKSMTALGGRSLLGSMARRSSVQLPTSPQASTPELALPSPEAIKRRILQGTRSRTRNNLPKETTHILLKWLNEHLNHPYPNSFEKTQLMISTGLTQQQLSNWFINARRRKIKVLRLKQKLESE